MHKPAIRRSARVVTTGFGPVAVVVVPLNASVPPPSESTPHIEKQRTGRKARIFSSIKIGKKLGNKLVTLVQRCGKEKGRARARVRKRIAVATGPARAATPPPPLAHQLPLYQVKLVQRFLRSINLFLQSKITFHPHSQVVW